jgi:hypothetical protein
MMQPPFKDPPHPNDTDPYAQAHLIFSHVRMTITQKEGGQTLAVPATNPCSSGDNAQNAHLHPCC